MYIETVGKCVLTSDISIDADSVEVDAVFSSGEC